MNEALKKGDKVRFAFKTRPGAWTPATVLEEVPIPEYHFYRVVTEFRLSKPETVMIGTRRCDIEAV